MNLLDRYCHLRSLGWKRMAALEKTVDRREPDLIRLARAMSDTMPGIFPHWTDALGDAADVKAKYDR